MKHETTRALYAYWDALRVERAAPFRSELDPRAIAPLLAHTFILEADPRAAPRFRLAGTRLCAQFGMELRGMNALSLWHGDGRREMRGLMDRVVASPGVGYASCTVETRSGHLFPAEFLFLPLYSDTGDLNRILGCGCYMGPEALDDDDLDGGDALTPPGAGPHALEGGAARQPIHHWVDETSLAPINGDGSARPGALERGFAPVDEGPITLERLASEAVDVADAASRRPRPPSRPRRGGRPDGRGSAAPAESAAARKLGNIRRAGRRPFLYAIDGGAPELNAIDRLAKEREAAAETQPASRRARHLRLVDDLKA